MVELADAPDSKSGGSNTVWVQVPLSAPKNYPNFTVRFFISKLINEFCKYNITFSKNIYKSIMNEIIKVLVDILKLLL